MFSILYRSGGVCKNSQPVLPSIPRVALLHLYSALTSPLTAQDSTSPGGGLAAHRYTGKASAPDSSLTPENRPKNRQQVKHKTVAKHHTTGQKLDNRSNTRQHVKHQTPDTRAPFTL